MKRNGYRRWGVFCLECDSWWDDLRNKSSVEPALRMLSDSHDSHFPFIHKDVATVEEFNCYLKLWGRKKYARYPVLYLAFHGECGCLHIGKERLELDDLKKMLLDCKHKAIIHFGSCETLKTDKRHLKRFMADTNILAVMGYGKEVEWFDSAAFELLLLREIQEMKFLTTTRILNLGKNIQKNLGRSAFYSRLGFTMINNENPLT